MSDIYLSLTETPAVVTLSQPVIASSVAATVTVGNTVTVALDANSLSALENVTVTVGAAVTVAGFSTSSLPPSTVTVANTVTINGTVTANVPLSQDTYAANEGIRVVGNGSDGALRIGGYDPSSGEQLNIEEGGGIPVFAANQVPLPISGTVTANDSGALSIVNSSTVTKADVKFTAIAGAYNASEFASTYSLRPLSTNSGGTLLIDGNVAGSSILSYDGWAHVRVAQSPGSVVTVGSLPAISGTVTANGGNFSTTDGNSTPPSTAVQIGWWNGNDEYNQVRPITPFPIGIVGRYGPDSQISNGQLLSVQKTSDYYGNSWDRYVLEVANVNSVTIGNSITIGSLPAISGTVTVGALPSGALTTRFGSVTTANTAQITSAVTNTSRKYLLAQNISAGTVTIGIGFSPTTTQGIQLPAGGGLTFDAFCPTGAIFWLGAVTGAAWTILEG